MIKILEAENLRFSNKERMAGDICISVHFYSTISINYTQINDPIAIQINSCRKELKSTTFEHQ